MTQAELVALVSKLAKAGGLALTLEETEDGVSTEEGVSIESCKLRSKDGLLKRASETGTVPGFVVSQTTIAAPMNWDEPPDYIVEELFTSEHPLEAVSYFLKKVLDIRVKYESSLSGLNDVYAPKRKK